MKILALDLGKFNTMCCFFDTKTRKHSFLNAATDRDYLTTVFKKHQILANTLEPPTIEQAISRSPARIRP
jgi:hypothetical protein